MYIGIDLGTSSIKALLVDVNGNILNEASKTYPLYLTKDNWSEQNPEDWYEAALEVLKKVTENHKDINAISFSGQMHGMVLLDKNDEVIRPAILWNDQRTSEEVDYLNEVIGKEKLLKYTGNIAVTGFTAPKILWMYNNEKENFDKIAKIMLPKDYLIYKFSNIFATDYSDASGTLYFDVEKKTYSKEMLKILNIDESKLPKAYDSFHVVGYLNDEIKALCQLNGNIKIAPGGGDQAIGAVGTGVVSDGEINISLGTSGVVFAASKNYFVDEKSYMHSFAHANGFYHIMGVTLSAAGSLQWWRDNFSPDIKFSQIFDDVKETEIEDSLIFLPYLTGERSPINDPYAQSAFIGAKMTHKKKHFSRAVVEGITFSLRQCFDLIKALGVSPNRIKLTGGGAREPFWAQMIADIFNSNIETIKAQEGPAYGAAIIAMVSDNVFDSVETACEKLIQTDKTYIPNAQNTKLYEQKYLKYLDLYPRLKTFFHK